jgi:hypothetical protein
LEFLNQKHGNNHLVSLGEKLDGGESLDLNILNFVGSRVHLCNDDIFRVLEVLSQFIPDGHQLLAVTYKNINPDKKGSFVNTDYIKYLKKVHS